MERWKRPAHRALTPLSLLRLETHKPLSTRRFLAAAGIDSPVIHTVQLIPAVQLIIQTTPLGYDFVCQECSMHY